jgi:hypothetical protein
MGGVAHTAVVLCFPDSAEVRFLERPPRRGQRVVSRSGNVWLVADVLRSGTRTYTVNCVSKRDFLRDLIDRRSAHKASELLALARRAIPAQGGVTDSFPDEASRRLKRTAESEWIEKYLEASSQDVAPPGASEKVSRYPKPDIDWIDEYLAATFAKVPRQPAGLRRTRLLPERKDAR